MLDRLVLATQNPGKVAELAGLLAPAGVRVLGLADLPGPFPEPDETGDTFDANATIKAIAYAAATGLPCIADDSGLVVDALDGAPGVISSHYATDGRPDERTREQRDHANNARILRELDGVPPERRAARFVCVMVLADANGHVLALIRGSFEGRIGTPPDVPRGSNGFGYDPLFLVAPHFTRTSAELAKAEKNALSHRGAASRAMLDQLTHLTNSSR
jgi:XTP/dITP diphosphohydrolase